MEAETSIDYETPAARSADRSRRSRRIRRVLAQLLVAFLALAASVALCATGGGLLARIISVLCPSYYPAVFHYEADHYGSDVVQLGVATGVVQGAAAGLPVGAVIILALAIGNRRRSPSPHQLPKLDKKKER